MTKERLIQLRANCSKYNPDMKELKELYEHILNKQLQPDSDPWLATQQVVLQYIDELIERG